MATGTVKWFNPTKGFGFIQPEGGGQDVFVHITAVQKAGLTGLDENAKVEYELETQLLGQKYFMEGQLIWVGNVGVRAAYENRGSIEDLPPDFDWPTAPEMEINLKAGTGVSYRFAPSWYAGVETIYETEFETEVGQERWSVFGGPSLHYGGQKWWSTLTYFPQIKGGGEKYPDQTPDDLHLIEKTKYEARLKIGYNF